MLFERLGGIHRQADPELLKSIKPWNKVVEPDPLRALLVVYAIAQRSPSSGG